jgi:predicted nuclease with TOPRIM domain
MDIETLRHLESKIEEMLTVHAAVCEERDRLREELGAVQGRMEKLGAELKHYESEKAEMRAHVERIMGRLASLDLG